MVSALITNCPIANNSVAGGSGGGIEDRGTVAVVSTTFAGNSAPDAGGAIDNLNGAHTIYLLDSILSGDSAGQLRRCSGR